MGVAGRLSGTVSPFRAEQGTSLETPSALSAVGCEGPAAGGACGGGGRALKERGGQKKKKVLKLKLQYFGHLMRSVDSLEKTLMLGGIGGRR